MHSRFCLLQRVESDSSVVEAPIQTLGLEPTQCCIQVLTATVKPQLLELISQYQHQVTAKSDCFREVEMPGGKRSLSKGKQVLAEEEKEKEKRKRMLSRAKMGAESRQAEPAAAASGSRAPSRTWSTGSEKKKEQALEMEE